MYRLFKSLVLIFGMCLSMLVFAEDEAEAPKEGEEGAEAAPPAAIYIPMKPEFVVNYGGVGKNKYLKAGVTMRLANSKAANSVRHHMPALRNCMVFVFAGQTDETLESQDGRESMRNAALEEIRNILEAEDGLAREDVVDVLFNALTWHG